MMKTIKLSSFQNGFLFLLALGFSLHWAPYLHAGVLYSDQELWASGDLWKKTEAQWNVEKARHVAALKKISASNLSRDETDFRIRQEFAFYKARTESLSRKSYDVQAVLIRESNARASGGKYRAPAPIKATQGTGGEFDPKITQTTFKQMQETLKDMGLNDTLPFKDGKLVSGATGTAIGFDLSMGANGWEPKVGSPLFKELIKSEANHPDAQLSKSMQNEASGTKDLGADYVAVLDYQKQALEVMKASSMEHSKDTNIAEKLAIAIYKAAEYLPQIDPSEKVPEEDRKAGYGLGDTNEVVNGDFTKGYNQQKLQKKLHDIASGKTKVKTPQDVEKLKKLGEAVFKAAERKTFRDARKKIASKRAEIKKLAKMQKRLDALPESPSNRAKKAKLKKSFIARKAALRKGIAKMNASNNAVASKKSPYTHTRSQAVVKKGGASRSVPKATGKQRMSPGKALNTANKILVIADIGNACKKLEDYREGKASLGDVVRGVVNLTPAGPIVNIYDKTKSTGTDFGDAYKNLTRANEQNLTAHLNQWEIRFRNAGMSQKDARSYVADAVLSGNLDVLESKADELRNQGKTIKSPKLVVEDCLPGPDGGYGYMWENTKDMGVGIVKGAYEGTVHIVTSPHRAVGAWHEGVLKEATLDYNSKTATSDMKTRLFRKLLDVGIDRNRALAAVTGSESMLKEVTREAQEKMKVIREEQAAIQAERDAFDQKLKSCMREISRLRFADASIKTTPSSPLKVPADTADDDVFPVEVSLSGSFTDRVGEIARMLEALTGKAPKVSYTYTCLIKSAKELSPSSWEVEVPGKPGNYPVNIHVRVSITSFTGIYKPIHRVIDRTIKGVISVKPSTESIRFTQKSYTLESEYPKELQIKVSAKTPEAQYFYNWLIGDEHFTTTKPALSYTSHLKKEDCPSTILATVLLCDRNSGCVLDEASTTLKISHPNHQIFDYINSDGSLCYRYEAIKVNYGENEKNNASDESHWVEIHGPKGVSISNRKHWTCLPHGRFERYIGGKGKETLIETGYFLKGKKERTWKTFTQEGKLNSLGNFKEGIRHGIFETYSDKVPGGISEKSEWKNNHLITKTTRTPIVQSGKEKILGWEDITQNAKVRISQSYNPEMKLTLLVEWKMNPKQSWGNPHYFKSRIVKKYFPPGKLNEVAHYDKQGNLDGISIIYDVKSPGGIMSYFNYKKGQRMEGYEWSIIDDQWEKSSYDRSGNLIR